MSRDKYDILVNYIIKHTANDCEYMQTIIDPDWCEKHCSFCAPDKICYDELVRILGNQESNNDNQEII